MVSAFPVAAFVVLSIRTIKVRPAQGPAVPEVPLRRGEEGHHRQRKGRKGDSPEIGWVKNGDQWRRLNGAMMKPWSGYCC